MKILFINLSGLNFTVLTPEAEPLGGTESCVCYLTRELAGQGHDVTLMCRLPSNIPPTIRGVRHVPALLANNQDFYNAENFDAIVIVNAPIAAPFVRELNPKAFIAFWNHVAPNHERVRELKNPLVLDSLNVIVYVSEWQKTETEKSFGIAKQSVVIGNGLTPAFENMFSSAEDLRHAKHNRAAYTTTPFRGLPLLLRVMDGLGTETQLDIYSSMRVYQVAEANDHYSALYREAQNNPAIHYHAPVAQTELATRLKPSAFLAYPCTYPETFCNVALEAMAAGMKVMTTDLAALRSTTMGYADLLPFSGTEPAFVEAFRNILKRNILEFCVNPDVWAEKMFDQVNTVNQGCTWKVRTAAWVKLLLAQGNL